VGDQAQPTNLLTSPSATTSSSSASADGFARSRPRRAVKVRWRGTYVLVAPLAATAVAFASLALAAHVVPYFEVDLQLGRAVQSFSNPTLDFVAAWIDWPGFPPQSNVLFGALVLALAVRRQVLAAIGQLLAAGGSAVLWFWIAPLVNRPRPSPDLVHVSAELPGAAFPVATCST
jgi:hypothetical protein